MKTLAVHRVQNWEEPDLGVSDHEPEVLEAEAEVVEADGAVGAAIGPIAVFGAVNQREEEKIETGSCWTAETRELFEREKEIGAAAPVPVTLAQAVKLGIAGAETLTGEDRMHRVKCMSRGSSEQRPPEGCCGWYSGWGKMQEAELEQHQELELARGQERR